MPEYDDCLSSAFHEVKRVVVRDQIDIISFHYTGKEEANMMQLFC